MLLYLVMFDSITIIDTETTNLNPELAEIVELGWTKWHKNQLVSKSQLFGCDNGIPPEASAKNCISNNMIKNKPKFIDCDWVESVLGYENSQVYLVAHNANYDQKVITNVFLKGGKNKQAEWFQHHAKWICTWRLSKILYGIDFTDMQYGLNYLRYKIPLPVGDDLTAHRAEADTIVAARLFEHLVEKAVVMDKITETTNIEQSIYDLSKQHAIYKTWPIGKNKGKKFDQIPMDYWAWALQNVSALDEKHPEYNSDLAHSIAEFLSDKIKE